MFRKVKVLAYKQVKPFGFRQDQWDYVLKDLKTHEVFHHRWTFLRPWKLGQIVEVWFQ